HPLQCTRQKQPRQDVFLVRGRCNRSYRCFRASNPCGALMVLKLQILLLLAIALGFFVVANHVQ
ncbi:MAG: hypothetical protein KGI54_19085, partial [Pseudomonadota bacterium]|nr:hypothetical protein [Pseudomonadota bacterium]